MDESKEKTWRCRRCHSLLGMEREGELHLKYKAARYVVAGVVITTCRRCSTVNQWSSDAAGSAGHREGARPVPQKKNGRLSPRFDGGGLCLDRRNEMTRPE